MPKREPLPGRIPVVEKVAGELCSPESYASVCYRPPHETPMPSLEALGNLMERLRAALFPGYYGFEHVRADSMRYHVAANLDTIYRILSEQIHRGACFSCAAFAQECSICETTAQEMALAFLERLPAIRTALAGDVQAAYEGDPAARSPAETIFCYPSIHAMLNHRVAHALYALKVPLIPRIISEMAHSRTGIDIHPGASIGDHFFIDHGTGVVIGETCVVGSGCRLYQGVTLGALSFPKDESGSLIKGIARHPILEDNVTVYAGATILGRVTIGRGAVIGGNVWITHDVAPGAKMMQHCCGAEAGRP